MKKVVDLPETELKELIIAAMDEALLGFFGHPDEGLELRPEIEGRLKKALEAAKKGERTYSLKEVKERRGLRDTDGLMTSGSIWRHGLIWPNSIERRLSGY